MLTTRAELLASGVAPTTIARRYFRVLPQVYSTSEPTWYDRCCAVVVWRRDTVLTHRTAACLYGWVDVPDSVDAACPVKSRTPGWLTMRRRDMGRESVEFCQGLPVTCREETLVDCVDVLDLDAAARLVDERLADDVDVDALYVWMSRHPRRRGNKRTRQLVAGSPKNFASEPERILGRELIVLGLRLLANVRVGPYICDFVDFAGRVVVEVDGREFHIDAEVFRGDRRRDRTLRRTGWEVIRYAAYDVLADPAVIAADIASTVRRRRRNRRRRA